MRTNRVALIRGCKNAIRAFVDVNIEVVEPEVGHLLFQLPVAVNCTIQFGFVQIISNRLLGRFVGDQFPALHGIGSRQHLLPHRLLERVTAFALTVRVLAGLKTLKLEFDFLPCIRILRKGHEPLAHGLDNYPRRIIRSDLCRAHLQRFQRLQPRP
jgi:hypothetical protein